MDARALVGTLVVLVLAGCGAQAAPPVSAQGPVPEGRAYPHDLLTHCGIRETRFAGEYWVTSPELHDGSHNPPAGWDNPFQRGTMRRLSPTAAEFRDGDGHVVVFTLRPGATGFERMCA